MVELCLANKADVAPPRRRFQYDLKHLLLVFLALTAVLGWLHQRERLKNRADQIEDLRRRTMVFEIGTILRGEMNDQQKRAALARYVKAGDPPADVIRKLGTPNDWWTFGKGRSDYDTLFYFPFATKRQQPGRYITSGYQGSWDGNFIVSFDAADKVVAVGYYVPVVGGWSPELVLDLRRLASIEDGGENRH